MEEGKMEKDTISDVFLIAIPAGSEILKMNSSNKSIEFFQNKNAITVNGVVIKEIYLKPYNFDENSRKILDDLYNYRSVFDSLSEQEKKEFMFVDRFPKVCWTDGEDLYFTNFDQFVAAFNNQKYLH
ncbi:MAG: hypothetical protein NZZ41_00500 [Candidatus Dojkabacteria bacterium]|nr:hypothetical protein [Candidatus Dojkabacteria bacterium]